MPYQEAEIKGYEDYTVDESGVIRSYIADDTPLIISTFVKSGYLYVRLSKNGKRKAFRVHRLVALAFVPNPHPRKYKVVMHLDDNKLNPHKDNLKWGTHLHNVRDMCKKGRHRNQHTVATKGKADES